MKHIKDMKNVSMKKLFRRNQMIVITLIVMTTITGYLNYTREEELAAESGVYEAGAMGIPDEDILAEDQDLLSGQGNLMKIPNLDQGLKDIGVTDVEVPAGNAGTQTDNGDAGAAIGAGGGAMATTETAVPSGLEDSGGAALASSMSVTGYIVDVQLNREQIHVKDRRTSLNIINSANIEENAKQAAIQNMIELTGITEKGNAAETLPMARGFSNPVVSITSGKTDMVVNAASITDAQHAQIEDVVKREAEVGAESIVITLLDLEE